MATDIKNDSTLSTSLLAHYKLEEASGNRVDSHGSYNLTATNSPGSTTGKQGDAITLNGTNQYLSSTNAALRFNSNMSYGQWVYITSTTPARHLLFNTFTSSGGNKGIIISIEKISGVYRPRFASYGGGTNRDVSCTTLSLSLNTWYYLSFAYNLSAGSVVVRLNGSSETLTGFGSSVNTSMTTAYFGIDGNLGSSNYFQGHADEFSIWQKVLSAGEHDDLYNSGNGIPYEASAPVANNGFQLWWA
jgi:hypothetical protein